MVCDVDLNILHMETQQTLGDQLLDIVEALSDKNVQKQIKHLVAYQVAVNQ